MGSSSERVVDRRGRRAAASAQPEHAARSRPPVRTDVALAARRPHRAEPLDDRRSRRRAVGARSRRRTSHRPSQPARAVRHPSSPPAPRVPSSWPSSWPSTRSPWRRSASVLTCTTASASTARVVDSLPSETVEDAVKLAEPLIASVPVGHHFAGVGVAVVGLTRRADGFVHLAPNLGWRDVPLGEMLAERLGRDTPISVANEADLGALASIGAASAPGVDNLLFVSGEVGIGVGVILGGKPGLGAAGYAGEAGHTLVNPAGVAVRVRGDRMLGDRGRRRRSAAPGRAGDRCRWPGLGRSGHRSCRGRRAAGASLQSSRWVVGSGSASPT